MGRGGQHRKRWGHRSAGRRRWLAFIGSRASGQLCPAFLSTPPATPPHVTPSDDLAPHRDGRGLPQTPLHLYPTFARAAPSAHLPSLSFCTVTFSG